MKRIRNILSDSINMFFIEDGLSNWASSRGVTDMRSLLEIRNLFLNGDAKTVKDVNGVIFSEFLRNPELFWDRDLNGLFGGCCSTVCDKVFDLLATRTSNSFKQALGE